MMSSVEMDSLLMPPPPKRYRSKSGREAMGDIVGQQNVPPRLTTDVDDTEFFPSFLDEQMGEMEGQFEQSNELSENTAESENSRCDMPMQQGVTSCSTIYLSESEEQAHNGDHASSFSSTADIEKHQNDYTDEQTIQKVNMQIENDNDTLVNESSPMMPGKDTTDNVSVTSTHSASPRKRRAKQQMCERSTITTRFCDIIGHGPAKLRLDEALLPLALPPSLARTVLTGVRAAPASILLHGPPGCGKTQLARAVAGEAQAAFLSVGPSDVLSKFVGESEASVRAWFKEAYSRARTMENRCAVLFFDEIDALGQSRGETGGLGLESRNSDNSSRRVLAELLIQMSGVSNHDDDDTSSGSEQSEGCDDDYSDEEGEYGGCQDNCTEGKETHPTSRDELSEIDCGHDFISSSSRNTFASHCEDRDSNEDVFSNRPHPITPVPHANIDNNPDCPSQETETPKNEGMDRPEHEESSARFSDTCKMTTSKHAFSSGPPETEKSAPAKTKRPKARIIVIAATNRPEDCDPALLRRFSVRVFVGLPSKRDRKKIVGRLLADIEHSINPNQLEEIAAATEGWSGSDLESLTREAAMAPIRECLRAAAVLKAKARRKQQSGGDESTQEKPSAFPVDEDEAARESLLDDFRNLRPVTVADFEHAVNFWLGDQQNHQAGGCQFGRQPQQHHYDSNSSSDED